jgi:hypothetical protein
MLMDHPQNIHQLLAWELVAIQFFNKSKSYFKTLELNKTTNCRKQGRVHQQSSHSGLFPKMNQSNVAIKICIKY